MARAMKRKAFQNHGLKAVSPGEKIALREGAQARREGYVGRNPYTKEDGEPIQLLRNLAAAWQRGYDAAI